MHFTALAVDRGRLAPLGQQDRRSLSLVQLGTGAEAAVTLDSYVNKIEDNPIELHKGKKRALTDAEKLLLVQQDELRKLRTDPPPPQAAAPAAAPAQQPMNAPPKESDGGGGGNIAGVLAAGVLGGLLYQSKKSNAQAQGEFEKTLAGKDKVCARVLAAACHLLALHILAETLAGKDKVRTP